jgi:hypothetical protein
MDEDPKGPPEQLTPISALDLQGFSFLMKDF